MLKRSSDETDEAKGVDSLARTVLEPVEFIETDRVDTEGNKIVLTRTMLEPIGFVRHGLVCENHHDKAWPDECDCGPGMRI